MSWLNPTMTLIAHCWAVFRAGGPVALGQVVRIARLERKLASLHNLVDREEALHERMMESLRSDINQVIGDHQAAIASRAIYQRYVARTNCTRSGA
jgi:hypothetical protein